MADRQLGLALDFSPSSNYALQWALDNLIREGDTVILLVVVKQTFLDESPEALWGAHGSPRIPLADFKNEVTMKRYNVTVNSDVISSLDRFMAFTKINVFGKVYYGDAKEKLVDAIVELPLDSVILGSRGLGGLRKVFLGSVSDYVVNNAPCPVTVVKLPEECS